MCVALLFKLDLSVQSELKLPLVRLGATVRFPLQPRPEPAVLRSCLPANSGLSLVRLGATVRFVVI
jgi:hypothetical protein